MSFDQLVRPTFAEARSTSLQEGFLFGLIPGVVTRVDDPERIGRVQVECPVIEPGINLPNSNDGWIPVMESFVVNGATGGSHSFVQVGSQVLMACLFGDPRQMIVVGCLPSRVDRPHPDLNRADGTYGLATPNETVEAFRDTDASAVISRPNGVLQTISGEGDIMMQTEERGRVMIQRDGTTSLNNDLSHTALSKDGEVSQRSAEGAESVLRANGEIDIKSSSATSLRLRKSEGTLEGPLNPLSAAIAQAGQLSATLGEAQGLLTDLQAIAQDFGVGGNLEGFLGDAQSVLEDLQNLSGSLAPGAAALRKLQDFSVEDLGKSLLPQVGKFLELGDLPQRIKPLLRGELTGEAIAQKVLEILPEDLAENFLAQQISGVLDGLQYDPAMQFQAILGAIAPDSFESIRNIIGLELHQSLGAIAQVIQAYQATPPPTQENPAPDPLAPAVAALRRQLPGTIQRFLTEEIVASALHQPDLDAALTILLGTSLSGLAGEAVLQVDQIREIAGKLTPLSEAAAALESGQATNQTPAQLQSSIFEQVAAITPSVIASLQSVNQLANAVPSGISGAKVRATPLLAQMETSLGAAGATVQVNPALAALVSPGGSSKVFASAAGVGLMGGGSSLLLGAAGGALMSLASFAFRAMQKDGQAVGLQLDPETGVASLSSYASTPDPDQGDETLWQNDTARVAVSGNIVRIEARAGRAAAHYIEVSPSGIFLDGFDVSILPSLVARISALEAAAVPPPPSGTP